MDTAVDIIKHVIAEANADLREISLSIHANPELSFKEFHAHKLLTEFLENRGYTVERTVAGLETAFVATYVSPAGPDGLHLGFCSEYDALPEIGHACGHNLIAISGVASFMALTAAIDELKIAGTVKLFGTPAEEGGGGKIFMHKAGVFDGTDALLMLHPGGGFDMGGYSGAWHSHAIQSLNIEYFGKSSHSALAPWMGVNAGSAAVIAMNALGVMREQLHPTWRVHAIIESGGKANNVVPDYAKISCGFRAFTGAELETLRGMMLKVFEAGAIATGCTHKITMDHELLDNIDNPVLGGYYEELMQAKYKVPPFHEDVGGSTDFGNLSHDFISLHGIFPLVGVKAPPHSAPFADAAKTESAHENALFAAETNARTALRCLLDPEFWAAAQKSFKERKPPGSPTV
ncbi:amidohydrolase-like protein [Linderina pennispora]|uniref:Peptidase M20 domain-containing protein 2 n=1 Tax=Linderina pennispora TaxID=61395 RepID=A0A1Y1WDU4_9FUNG|nr:amidohydrolase-like protein [Linderina pennispora]ORX71622.1 amidohydrolase-like protein [Linderina pennispora]